MLKTSWLIAGLALYAFALMSTAPPALAADGAVVTLPYGAWLDSARAVIIDAVIIAFAWFCRHLPGYAVALMKTLGVDQMLRHAVGNAINSVAGAGHGAALKVDVGNEVVAEALNYVTRHAPEWLVLHAGGWPSIREKIIARLELEPEAVVRGGMIARHQPVDHHPAKLAA